MSEEQVTGLGLVGVKEWSGERRRWLPRMLTHCDPECNHTNSDHHLLGISAVGIMLSGLLAFCAINLPTVLVTPLCTQRN